MEVATTSTHDSSHYSVYSTWRFLPKNPWRRSILPSWTDIFNPSAKRSKNSPTRLRHRRYNSIHRLFAITHPPPLNSTISSTCATCRGCIKACAWQCLTGSRLQISLYACGETNAYECFTIVWRTLAIKRPYRCVYQVVIDNRVFSAVELYHSDLNASFSFLFGIRFLQYAVVWLLIRAECF